MNDENNMYENNGQPVNTEPVYNGGVSGNNYQDPGKGFGIASLVCGILALITCCLWCTCIPLAVVSIVLGILQIKKGSGVGKGMAIAGIICAAVGLVLFIALTVWGNYLESSGFMDQYYDMLRQYGYY